MNYTDNEHQIHAQTLIFYFNDINGLKDFNVFTIPQLLYN